MEFTITENESVSLSMKPISYSETSTTGDSEERFSSDWTESVSELKEFTVSDSTPTEQTVSQISFSRMVEHLADLWDSSVSATLERLAYGITSTYPTMNLNDGLTGYSPDTVEA